MVVLGAETVGLDNVIPKQTSFKFNSVREYISCLVLKGSLHMHICREGIKIVSFPFLFL